MDNILFSQIIIAMRDLATIYLILGAILPTLEGNISFKKIKEEIEDNTTNNQSLSSEQKPKIIDEMTTKFGKEYDSYKRNAGMIDKWPLIKFICVGIIYLFLSFIPCIEKIFTCSLNKYNIIYILMFLFILYSYIILIWNIVWLERFRKYPTVILTDRITKDIKTGMKYD